MTKQEFKDFWLEYEQNHQNTTCYILFCIIGVTFDQVGNEKCPYARDNECLKSCPLYKEARKLKRLAQYDY